MVDWVDSLSGTAAHGSELDWLGPAGDRVRAELGESVLGWAVEFGEQIALEVTPMVDGAGSHFNAVKRATTSSVVRVLLLLVNRSQVDLMGPENREIIRDLARRGVGLDAMQRSVRHGFSSLAEVLLDAAEKAEPVGGHSEVKRVALLLFTRIDGFLDTAASVYHQEIVDYQTTMTATRLDLVRKILAGSDHVDIDAASNTLGYPVGAAQHLAVVAWTPHPDYGTILRSTLDSLFMRLGAGGTRLVLPVGSHVMWAWIALEKDRSGGPAVDFVPPEGGRATIGRAGNGLDGFRRSHRQARAVEDLVRRRGSDRPVLTYASVELPALLTRDPAAARDMVDRILGPLAEPTPRMIELRQTLLCYLDHERSISRVSAELHISRGTVTYRVQQAMRLCRHDPEGSPLLLHVALSTVDWLT